MSNVISLDEKRREREQRRITPQLEQVEKMRQAARLLLLNAEIMEMEAYGMSDINYDDMAEEKVAGLEALHA